MNVFFLPLLRGTSALVLTYDSLGLSMLFILSFIVWYLNSQFVDLFWYIRVLVI